MKHHRLSIDKNILKLIEKGNIHESYFNCKNIIKEINSEEFKRIYKRIPSCEFRYLLGKYYFNDDMLFKFKSRFLKFKSNRIALLTYLSTILVGGSSTISLKFYKKYWEQLDNDAKEFFGDEYKKIIIKMIES